jgi:hypothetical protein
MKYRVTRDLPVRGYPWLARSLFEGDTVYRFTGPTYGAIGPGGTAVSFRRGEHPFFEVPDDSIEEFG